MADFADLDAALTARRQQHLYRQRPTLDSAQGVLVTVEGRRLVNFCSNDYLGLADHPDIKTAAAAALDRYGTGSGASHLVCGHSRPHHELEEALARFTGRERALLFSTGYMANLGVITALLGKGDYVFEDKLNHASLIDGGLLSGARFQRFLHNDINNLRNRLKRADAGRKLIAVDGVFSMDGDIAPLTELADLADEFDACLMVDDAHGIGVLGQRGAGCGEYFNLDQRRLPVLMGTLGKSVGSFGAFVAGSEALIETLIQFARPYIYTTALPPAVAAASLAALTVIEQDHARRAHLHGLIEHFRVGAAARGLQVMPSTTAIQPVHIGDSARAVAISQQLVERGMMVGAIRPPTVPANTARLRITLSAAHSEQQVDDLLSALTGIIGAG